MLGSNPLTPRDPACQAFHVGLQAHPATYAMNIFTEIKVAGNQRRIAVLVGIGFVLGAIPVYMHSRGPPEKRDAYHAQKKRQREQRLAWMQSDEMPDH